MKDSVPVCLSRILAAAILAPTIHCPAGEQSPGDVAAATAPEAKPGGAGLKEVDGGDAPAAAPLQNFETRSGWMPDPCRGFLLRSSRDLYSV